MLPFNALCYFMPGAPKRCWNKIRKANLSNRPAELRCSSQGDGYEGRSLNLSRWAWYRTSTLVFSLVIESKLASTLCPFYPTEKRERKSLFGKWWICGHNFKIKRYFLYSLDFTYRDYCGHITLSPPASHTIFYASDRHMSICAMFPVPLKNTAGQTLRYSRLA